jgi:hypothetical protein
VLLAAFAVSAVASAEPASTAPEPYGPADGREIRGIDRPGRDSATPVRELANTVLWPLRSIVDLVFLTTGTAGGLLENEQIVPRAKQAFFTRGGELGVFPTIFLETGTTPNIGARMIGSAGPLGTTLRAGYGGEDENVVESRLRFTVGVPDPTVLSIEAMHDRRAELGFLGVGQTPETDARNHFRFAPGAGLFRERRERLVLGYGLRPVSDVELLFSSSYLQRHAENRPNAGTSKLLTVFLPQSIPGAFQPSRITYTEVALRFDDRTGPRGVDTGTLVEGYAGLGRGVAGDDSRFWRAGFRIAEYIPFIRRTTVLSPKIVVDATTPIAGYPVPFRELTGQPSFRGFDNRRDYDSVVVSLDYCWFIQRFLAGRLFLDTAKVFPTFRHPTFEAIRYAGGFGFDLHTSASEIGRIAVAFSPEGVSFLFTLGVVAGFGDRQHRD